jgi:RHS repeat-associated protein
METTGVSGEILWKGNYKPWGSTVEQIGIAPPDHEYNIRFQGHHFDGETNLHYNRYRYYAPATGRFIGVDPIRFSGGLNVYQYAPNPTAWIDPFGLSSCPCNPCSKYDIGIYSDLKSRSMPGDKLNINHAMQAQPASQVIPNYNYVSAPAIAVPRAEHIRIPTPKKGIYTGSARQLLAKDIRDLRAHTGAPNECLQNLIRLNKETYPASLAK